MTKIIAAAMLALSVNANAVAFKKKVDPAKLQRELTAAGCQVSSVFMAGDGSGDIVAQSCPNATIASVVAAHVYQDPAAARAALLVELGAFEDQIDAGMPFTPAQNLRFHKIILIILGLNKSP
jgi:hypothetical protein